MRNQLTLTFTLIFIFSFSQTDIKEKLGTCPNIFKNKIKRTVIEPFYFIDLKDTLHFNVMKFECVYSSLYTHKVMYDKFGKWNRVELNQKKSPFLIWEKIQLLENNEYYTIVTSGIEDWKYIYAGVSVLDENGNDVLSEDSNEREMIMAYFHKAIKENKDRNDKFYEVFWMSFDPARWEVIQNAKSNK